MNRPSGTAGRAGSHGIAATCSGERRPSRIRVTSNGLVATTVGGAAAVLGGQALVAEVERERDGQLDVGQHPGGEAHRLDVAGARDRRSRRGCPVRGRARRWRPARSRPATRGPRTSPPHRPTRRAARRPAVDGGGRPARRPGHRSAARSGARPWRPRRCRAGGTRRRGRPIPDTPAPARPRHRRAGRRGARSAAADRPGSAHLRQRPPDHCRTGRAVSWRARRGRRWPPGRRSSIRRRPLSEPAEHRRRGRADGGLQLAQLARRREVLVLGR